MMAEHQSVVVLDTGSGVTKAGFCGEDSPKVIMPSIVGRPRISFEKKAKTKTEEIHVGNEALAKRGVLSVKYPIEYGCVTNWDDWEVLCFHTFQNELEVNMEEQGLLLIDTAMRPRVNAEKYTQMAFETFNVPYFYLASDAVMSLLQSGRKTGIVLEVGEGANHIVPVYEGVCLRYATGHTEINGRSLTDYMRKLLAQKGFEFYTSSSTPLVQDIKKTVSYVALDFDEELKSGSERRCIKKTYDLPSGEKVTLESERFQCPEPLFQPRLIGIEMPGVHEIVYNSIRKCNPDLHKDMYANIVPAGGCVSFPGFTERMSKEMTNLAPNTMEVNVVNQSSVVKYPAWKGGSIFASDPNFFDISINKDEYDEWGPSMVFKKCL